MKVKEIRELSPEELQSKIAETRKEIMELRFQHAALKLESPVKLRTARRKLAQMLTLQTEALRN
jgi:large subunit ribosomal protein L29